MNRAREELLRSLVEKLGGVMRGVHTGHRFPFGDFTLGASQVRILFNVARSKEGVSVRGLAQMLGVTSGAVTQFIDGLVEKGLVRRGEDASDRRVLRIKLTDAAERRFKRFRKDYFAAVSRVFGTLSDGELEQLIRLLGKTSLQPGVKECNK